METLQKVCLVFTIIGGIVWGIYGLFDINIVDTIFANMIVLAKIIYIIIGITSIVNIGLLFNHIENK